MPKKLTQAEFLAKAVAVHGVGRYDYSQAVYVNADSKVKITCPVHGDFEQAGGSHIRGVGCRKCGLIKNSDARSSNTQLFIQKAQAIHGIRAYDYSLVEYMGNKYHVKIICPAHGIFSQKPNNHLYYGCNKCGFVKGSKKLLSNTSDFIERAQGIHGKATYDYSLTSYGKSSSKVVIICPQHGEFKQEANRHLQGSGCPRCGMNRKTLKSKLSWADMANGRECILYFIKVFSKKESFYKVGITFHSIKFRYRNNRYLNGYSYEVLAIHKSFNAHAVAGWEQSILETFSHLSYKPSQYFEGETECFSEAEPILAIFPL